MILSRIGADTTLNNSAAFSNTWFGWSGSGAGARTESFAILTTIPPGTRLVILLIQRSRYCALQAEPTPCPAWLFLADDGDHAGTGPFDVGV